MQPLSIFPSIVLIGRGFLSQIDSIVKDYGLVVISRSGSNPEKFIYESDQLSQLQVQYFALSLRGARCIQHT